MKFLDENKKLLTEGFSLLRNAAFYNIIIFILRVILSYIFIIFMIVTFSSFKPSPSTGPSQGVSINTSALTSFLPIIINNC
jgi:hypothetical protein